MYRHVIVCMYVHMQLLEDDDVANERREVLLGDDRHSDNVVVIKNLSKASTLLIRTQLHTQPTRQKGKGTTNMSTIPRTARSEEKNKSCPGWDSNPHTLQSRLSALPTQLPGQLSWQGFESTTQYKTKANLKPLCYMAEHTKGGFAWRPRV